MINNKKLFILSLAVIMLGFAAPSIQAEVAPQKSKVKSQELKTTVQPISEINAVDIKPVQPLDLVATPAAFLNSKVKIAATFDKFSTLGLDYKPAMRDSKEYISLLIKRPDVTDHTIPLSELKLIIPRDKAEKLIDLESGDQIEIMGQVFSTALNDPWVDINNVKVISSKTKTVSSEKKTQK